MNPTTTRKETPARCNERELPTDMASKEPLTITRKETTTTKE